MGKRRKVYLSKNAEVEFLSNGIVIREYDDSGHRSVTLLSSEIRKLKRVI